ncbi:hypothetical protein N9A45_00295 [bacterium]|nr:hypothetical protein [bacterium]
MSKAHFQCQKFQGAQSIQLGATDFTVAVSRIATGSIGTHFWNHARAQEGKRKAAAIYCHDVTECTFVVLTSRVPGEYPLTWSFHAPPGSLPGSTGHGTVAASIRSFYKRVAEESGRLMFQADFDLIVVGVEASSIHVYKIMAELSKIAAVKSVQPLVHTVTGYRYEMFTMGELCFHADSRCTGKSEEHTCYDMYFFPTQSVQDKKVLITKGKGKNRGKQETVLL